MTVRLKGRLQKASARVVEPIDPAWEEDRRIYEARWRSMGGRVTGPVVEITLDG